VRHGALGKSGADARKLRCRMSWGPTSAEPGEDVYALIRKVQGAEDGGLRRVLAVA